MQTEGKVPERDRLTNEELMQEMERRAGLTRRAFLRSAGLGVASVGALAALGCSSPSTTASASESASASAASSESSKTEETAAESGAGRVVDELPIPEAKAPEKTEYECDILVIGGFLRGSDNKGGVINFVQVVPTYAPSTVIILR